MVLMLKVLFMAMWSNNIKDADVIVSYVHTVFNGNQPSGIDRLVDNVLSSIFPNQDLNFSPEILQKLKFLCITKALIVIVDLNVQRFWKQSIRISLLYWELLVLMKV